MFSVSDEEGVEFEKSLSLIDLYERQVSKSPSAIAVLLENGKSFSYSALNILATNISRVIVNGLSMLGSLNIDEDVDEEINMPPLITVIMNRDIGIIATFLGVLKSGAAYIPVDPTFPPDRKSYIMKQSRSHLLVIDEENLTLAKFLGVAMPPTVVIDSKTGFVSSKFANPTFRLDMNINTHTPKDEDDDVMHEHLHVNRTRTATEREYADDKLLVSNRQEAKQRPQGGLAYILFTSGSTGQPKGCAISHQSVIAVIQAFGSMCEIGQGMKVLGLTTYSFDISILETYLPLLHGATLLLAFESTQRDAFRLLDIVTDMQVDVMQATPTTYEMLMAAGFSGNAHIQLLIGGEAFRPSLMPLVPICKAVFNVYGPTETCIWSSAYRIPKDYTHIYAHGQSKSMSIGQPLPYERLYLASRTDYKVRVDNDNDDTSDVDREEQEVEPEGELIIGGIAANSGKYIHAPHLTATVFHDNPYGDNGRIYQTGDIFKKTKNGDFLFVCRKDEQVKIDGYRIELEEIESTFKTCDAATYEKEQEPEPEQGYGCIDTCIAIVRKKQIILYLKPKAIPRQQVIIIDSNGNSVKVLHITPEQLNNLKIAAARSLMYYMMPKHYVIVQSFAMTLNLKIDRKMLPDPIEWASNERYSSVPIPVKDVEVKEVIYLYEGFYSTNTIGTAAEVAARDEEYADAGYTMLKHVIAMIYKSKGFNPKPSDNFANIGVDSLGAIIVIATLSESLQGLRIGPADVFTPGITVEIFAKTLYCRMITEKPGVMESLGIVIESLREGSRTADADNILPTEWNATAEDSAEKGIGMMGKSYSSAVFPNSASATLNGETHRKFSAEEQHKKVEIEKEEESQARLACAWSFEQEFETLYTTTIASNIKILDGIRFVFTLVVLFDHFWVNTSWYLRNRTLGCSINMFMVVTGWGTALQTRDPLKFSTVVSVMKKQVQDAHMHAHTCNGRSSAGGNNGTSVFETEHKILGYILHDKPIFNWKKFLMIRIVGIFPILWLALILNAPFWVSDDQYRREMYADWLASDPATRSSPYLGSSLNEIVGDNLQSPNGAICTTLYVFGMNSWYRPQCRGYGPNIFLYSSIIWGVFLLHILPKLCYAVLQKKIMHLGLSSGADTGTSTSTNTNMDTNTETIIMVADGSGSGRSVDMNISTEIDSCPVSSVDTTTRSTSSSSSPITAAYYSADNILIDTTGDTLYRQLGDANTVQSWSEYWRGVAFRTTFNRPNSFIELCGFLFVSIAFTCAIMIPRGWHHLIQMKNSPVYFPDFIGGLIGANCLECIFYYRFITRKRNAKNSVLDAWRWGTEDKYSNLASTDSTDTSLPVKFDSLEKDGDGHGVNASSFESNNQIANVEKATTLLKKWKKSCFEPFNEIHNSEATGFSLVLQWIQRIAPDMWWAVFFILCSDWGPLLRHSTDESGNKWFFNQWLAIELAVLGILFAYFLQERKYTECCFSRYLLESRPCTAVGHSSYVVYLLQRVAIDGYGPMISRLLTNKTYDFQHRPGAYWFGQTFWLWKFCGLGLLMFFCWLIQIYFQDYLVMKAYIWAQQKWNAWGKSTSNISVKRTTESSLSPATANATVSDTSDPRTDTVISGAYTKDIELVVAGSV